MLAGLETFEGECDFISLVLDLSTVYFAHGMLGKAAVPCNNTGQAVLKTN